MLRAAMALPAFALLLLWLTSQAAAALNNAENQPSPEQQPQQLQRQQQQSASPGAPTQTQRNEEQQQQQQTYTCAHGKPVPKPPSFAQLPPVPAGAPSTPEAVAAVLAATSTAPLLETWPTLPGPEEETPGGARTGSTRRDGMGSHGPGALGLCTAGSRTPMQLGASGPPGAQGAAKLFISKVIAPLPAGCNYTLPRHMRRCSHGAGCTSECSGNTLSDGLIMAAAHCVDPAYVRLRLRRLLRDTAGYPSDIKDDPCGINTHPVTITAVVACYDYEQTSPDSGGVRACLPDRRYLASGVSWHERPPLTAAETVTAAADMLITASYDQSIIFMAAPITHLPDTAFYRYTYKDYYAADTPVHVESFSYIGDCGAETLAGEACPPVACQLSRAGPATFKQPTTLGASPGPEGINMPITSFAGASGSCALHNADQCCYASCSWGITTCRRDCAGNYFSPLMSDKPLSDLWNRRMVVLPVAASQQSWADEEEEQ